MLLIPTLLLVACIVLAAMIYLKIWKVHLATYQLQSDLAVTRRETEALFSQMLAAIELKSVLDLDRPMPATRGWAGSPDFLLHLAQAVLRDKPQAALECSSGVSTLVVARCMQRNGTGHVWSLEHEPQYAAKTRALLREHGLQEWATVLDAPLEQGLEGSAFWYRDAALPSILPPVDLLVVDGPPESIGPMARAPAFGRLRNRLSERAKVFIDDADRPDETEMVKRWVAIEPTLVVERQPAEKGLAVLSRAAA